MELIMCVIVCVLIQTRRSSSAARWWPVWIRWSVTWTNRKRPFILECAHHWSRTGQCRTVLTACRIWGYWLPLYAVVWFKCCFYTTPSSPSVAQKVGSVFMHLQLTNPDISLQDVAAALSKIEPEKTSKVQESKSFLVANPNCASAPQLHSKVDEANRKYTKIEQLLQCSQDKYETFLCTSKIAF